MMLYELDARASMLYTVRGSPRKRRRGRKSASSLCVQNDGSSSSSWFVDGGEVRLDAPARPVARVLDSPPRWYTPRVAAGPVAGGESE